MSPNSRILLMGVFNPKLFNNLVASWFLINLNFLPSQTAYFNKGISFP